MTEPAEWHDEIAAARKNGYAIDDGRYIGGVAIAAAPVCLPNGTINALVVVGVAEQMRRLSLLTIGEDLRVRAAEVSRALGA